MWGAEVGNRHLACVSGVRVWKTDMYIKYLQVIMNAMKENN